MTNMLELFYQTESPPRSLLRQRSVGCDGWTDQRLVLDGDGSVLSLRRELGSKGQPIRHAANGGKKTREGGWEK